MILHYVICRSQVKDGGEAITSHVALSGGEFDNTLEPSPQRMPYHYLPKL